MSKFSFQQVDVFTATPLKGNPLAVVVGADGVSDATMAALDAKFLEICPWSLREGIVLRHLEQDAGPVPLPLQALQPLQPAQPAQSLRPAPAEPDAIVTALERRGS